MPIVDWKRLAEPTSDRYDTGVILEKAAARGYRRPPGGEPAFLDGAVSLAHVYAGEDWSPPVPDAAAEVTPAVRECDRLLARAPTLREQVKALVFAIHPARYSERGQPGPTGSSRSHSLEHRFGTLWATVDCPVGLAHAVVHEMAHQKLRALGVSVESRGVIVDNPLDDLFPSPVLPRPRPMSAVLHALYSFAYVLELDLACAGDAGAGVPGVVQGALRKNVVRVENGYLTLRGHARPGAHGDEFLPALYAWVERLVGRAHLALRALTS